MTRWQPGTPGRLQQAALDLFATRGYERTTAAEIARSVGLTERTFFRHFSDKREVIFYGQEQYFQTFLSGIEDAPADASVMEMVGCALQSASTFFPDERRPHSRARQSVIEQNPALKERDQHKSAALATALSDTLRERGVDALPAALAAQSGATVFGIAFTQWIHDGERRSLADICTAVLTEFLALSGP